MARTLGALAAVLVLTAAAVAQSALAAPNGSRGKHSSASPVEVGTASAEATGEGSTATATATCPGGTKAAGGGFEAPSSADVAGLVYESVKVHNRSWRASVQVYDPGAPSTLRLTTYVYCRAHLPATKTASTTVPTTGELQVGPTASASCPNGETVVAGGFHMPPPLIPPTVTDLFFDSLRSGESGWDARVVTGPAGPSVVTSEAYCSQAASPPLETTAPSAPSALDSESRTASASCPPGLSPAAGGFAQPDSGPLSFFFIYSSRRVGDAWQVDGLHSGSEPAVAFSAAAYCA